MSYLIIGIFVASLGAALLALAMVTQRYALSYPTEKVPFFGVGLHRDVVWFGGLIIYGIANGLYAASLLFGPLSLLAGVFTTLLVYNMLFAHFLIGEQLTPSRVVGGALILCGVVLCAAGTPNGIETDFTPREVIRLSSRPIGAIYIVVLVLLVVLSVAIICWYEGKYPTIRNAEDSKEINPSASHANCMTNINYLGTYAAPPLWLDNLMGVVYPASLGIDEGIAHLTMKASISMLDNCSDANQCGMSIMYIYIAVWIAASIATLWWLRRVFGRYEATSALPVEYGSVNVVSVCSGLIFYQESQFMSGWQLFMLVLGVTVILGGISVGRLSSLPRPFETKALGQRRSITSSLADRRQDMAPLAIHLSSSL